MVILVLPRQVVDRIAAGEVVERPSAVVKELVENALDAGATEISVAVDGGGLELIRVADNGIGIPQEDLPLALASHSTSKLVDVDDLYHIASFGFRGEALSSIGAVSHTRITSSTSDDGSGFSLTCDAGVTDVVSPATCPRGTIIEVRDLFFNTPARRGFLGAQSTEAARCREVVTSLSLVNPGVRLRIDVDGRRRFSGDGAPGLRDRITAVYGADFVSGLVPFTGQRDGLTVEGFVTLPAAARPRPRAQLLFVNGRLVRDRAIQSAVRTGCKDFLPGSLQPAWVVCLRVDPTRLDVNVHPTKAEVRFRDREPVFGLVRRSVRESLLQADLAPRVRAEHMQAAGPPPGGSASPPWPRPATVHSQPDLRPRGGSDAPAARWSGPPSPQADVTRSSTLPAERVGEALPLGPVRPAAHFLQVLDTYIAHDSPEGLVLVDQHALHERVLYARLQKDLADGKLECQGLLIPETLRLEPSEHAQALERSDELARLGLVIEPFGPDTIVVRAVPAVLRGENLSDLVRALIDPVDLHGGVPHGLDRRLFTMACHAAVKAGDPLDEQEIADLLRQGAELEHDATCPHGRPTRLVIGRVELERLFKRSGF